MDGFILSIDQGTSGSKVTIFNHAGAIVASAFQTVTQYYPHQGWIEQDANEIWQKTQQAIAEALRSARILAEDIRAIGISNQRCTTVLWNKSSGEPIGRAITWQDRRTQEICERLSPAEVAELEERSGVTVAPNASRSKLQWLIEKDRAVQKAVAHQDLLFGTIDTWLIWKLSGGEVHVTDYSNASTTGLLNAQDLTYDEWILKKFGVPREILPELRSSSEIYAYTSPQVFYGERVPIAGCVGDQPAAAFGQACYSPGMIKNTYGTGAFMILSTGPKHYPAGGGQISPVLWTVKGRTTYGLEGYADVSGAVLNWLRDGLGILGDVKDADGLAIQAPDTQGVYFVPALVGLGAPYNNPNTRGTIFGIHLGTNKYHIARAALESMAYQTCDSLFGIERTYGARFTSLRVDGGGARSDFLMQFQADILGIPVDRPTVTEASSQGAAYLAGLAIGYWQSLEELAGYWKLDTRFEPRISAARREDLYAGWLRAVEYANAWGADRARAAAQGHPANPLDRLSPREREVVRLITTGKSMREIAALSYTSLKTVQKQRRDAMRKLGVENLAGLIRICLDLGLNH